MTDHLWVRVVDPAVALAARTYSSDDHLVIELTDPFLPANEGRWSIAGAGDGAEVRRTDADADLALSAPELGALYLGGVSATTLATRGPDHGTGAGCDRAGRPLLRLHARAVVRHRLLATAQRLRPWP